MKNEELAGADPPRLIPSGHWDRSFRFSFSLVLANILAQALRTGKSASGSAGYGLLLKWRRACMTQALRSNIPIRHVSA